MDLTQKFLSFALLGEEWVLWLLIILSVVSVAIMIERVMYFAARRVNVDDLASDLRRCLKSNDRQAFEKKYAGSDSIEVLVALEGLRELPRGPDAVAEAMIGAKAKKRLLCERYIAYLGTLGNNAPFIGLFGTVLGIIRAFRDLAKNSESAEAVMAGISQALVATAVGLLVAIPAVLAFNYFNRRVRTAIAHTDSIAHTILCELRGTDQATTTRSKEAA
jgi:biopolymer transport protein ExbB